MGPPVPYWPSVVVKPDTVSGVQTYYVNLILDIIFGGFALTVGIASILVTTTDPVSAIAAAAVIGSATCGLVIVFVINFIVALMSVIRMHHGAREYGPDHQKNAGRGVLFKWIGTTMSTLAAILVGGLFLPPCLAVIGYIMFLCIYSKTKDRLSKGLMQLYASVPPPMVWVPPVPPPPVAPNPGFAPPVAGTTIACPKCGFASPPMNAFCMNCGASLKS